MKFAIVQRTDKGISAKVTQDITLTKGQMLFFNDYEESINFLASKGFITNDDANKQIEEQRKRDREYKRETLYILNAAEKKEKL